MTNVGEYTIHGSYGIRKNNINVTYCPDLCYILPTWMVDFDGKFR